MFLPFAQIASIGMSKDTPTQRLSPHAWTDARNVVFRDAFVKAASKYSSSTVETTGITFVEVLQSLTEAVKVYATNVAVFGGGDSGISDITRVSGPYTGETADWWNAEMFNGFGVLNNGVDKPQVWNPLTAATPLIDMAAWQTGVFAKVLRGYKNFLIALDVTKSSVRDKRLVKWSHSADPNTLPSSWDETDATKDAGEVSLHSGSDGLVDCLPLGESNILYTDEQTWSMKFIGGQDIFAFNRIFPASGLLAQGCAKAFASGHFAVTQDDIVVHNGASVTSVADGAVRRWFFANLRPEYYRMTRVVRMLQDREMWIFFSSYGATLDLALIWNWRYNTWTLRDLPNVMSAASSLVTPAYSTPPDTWDAADGDWTYGSSTWEGVGALKRREILVMVESAQMDIISESQTGSVICTLERTGIALASDGTADEYNFKKIISVRPSFGGPLNTPVTISIGHQDSLGVGSAVTWDETGIFYIGTDTEIQLNATGRYIAVKFVWTDTSGDVEFYGYGIEQVMLGEGL